MKIRSSLCFFLIGCSVRSVVAQECNLTPSSLTFDLTGLSGISFVGSTPKITRLASDNPMLKILKYGSPEPPQMQVADGKLIVTSGPCLTTPTSGDVIGRSTLWTFFCVMATSIWNTNMAGGLALLSVLPMALADLDACENVLEVEIHGPEKSEGAKYMEREIRWLDYDASEGSLHFEPEPTWGDDVEAVRAFRETASGGVYNYRNKVLMGMAQTSVLNEPPEVTPKDAVEFDIPTDVVLPATNEEIMMLSVLEMQGLLRSGELTSTQLTTIALEMLDKYDPEFNLLEVELKDLALQTAATADEFFANGTYVSAIQGIPFAVKDTYDVKGYATAYGSWEFMNNVVGTESPLVTYAIEALAVPLFKSSVPQLTWGYANYKGTVYSCLNGGFAAGAGGSGGSSIGSGAAVCLGVVPVAICEQTGSSCQAPAIANGISTVIPALGTFSRENNGLYSISLSQYCYRYYCIKERFFS